MRFATAVLGTSLPLGTLVAPGYQAPGRYPPPPSLLFNPLWHLTVASTLTLALSRLRASTKGTPL